MPGRTNSDKIEYLQERFNRLASDLDNLEEKHTEEIASLHDDNRRLATELSAAIRDIAVLQERCVHLGKQQADTEQRRWQIILAMLTGLIALIVALVKK